MPSKKENQRRAAELFLVAARIAEVERVTSASTRIAHLAEIKEQLKVLKGDIRVNYGKDRDRRFKKFIGIGVGQLLAVGAVAIATGFSPLISVGIPVAAVLLDKGGKDKNGKLYEENYGEHGRNIDRLTKKADKLIRLAKKELSSAAVPKASKPSKKISAALKKAAAPAEKPSAAVEEDLIIKPFKKKDAHPDV